MDSDADQVWCFQCGNTYDSDVEECTECGVPTTAEAPRSADDVGGEDEPQLAYEFHEWTGQGRSILDGMLTRLLVDHAWQGATLIVREEDEEAVDKAIAETEVVAMPTLDLSQPTMIYELGELDDDQHGRLLRRLSEEGLGHAFDKNGDLYVYEKDEERVDGVFESLDEEDPAEREFGPGVPGADPVDVMSELFLAAGRLKKKPTDAKGIVSLVEYADIAGRMTLPYGLQSETWAGVIDVSGDLAAVLKGESELTEGSVQEVAEYLHTMLRAMV